jgi:cobalt/nickel transport system permease protein
VIVEELARGDSVVHRLDPRVKLVVAGVFCLIVAVAEQHACLGVACVSSVVLLCLARLPLKQLCVRLLGVNSLIVFLWLFLPFTYSGQVLFSVGPLHATREGIGYAMLITVKSNTILLALIALLATTPTMTLGHAMSHLRVPDKLIHLFFFTFRYVQVLHLEYQRLRTAMRVRGFTPGTNMHTYRSFAYLIGMLLVKSVDRADRIRKAMLCRGFHGRMYLLSHFALTRSDLVVLGIMTLVIGSMAALEYG